MTHNARHQWSGRDVNDGVVFFLAESPCTWRSVCKHYQLVYSRNERGRGFMQIRVDGIRARVIELDDGKDLLIDAVGWCQDYGAGREVSEDAPGVFDRMLTVGDDAVVMPVITVDTSGVSKEVLEQLPRILRRQSDQLIDDINLSQRHRFGGQVESLTDLDRASVRWLSAGVVCAFVLLVLFVVIVRGPRA